MSNASPSPMALYQANLDLVLRLTQLHQQTGQQWLRAGTEALQDRMADARAQSEELGKAANWQALAALPAEAFWRQLQQHFSQAQAATGRAAQQQADFAAGVQDAVRQWQQQATETLGASAAQPPPAAQAMQDFLAPWRAWLPARGDTAR